VGIKGKALPPPQTAAGLLQRRAVEVVSGWFATFGPSYVKLSLGYEFLRHCDSNTVGKVPISNIVREVEFLKEKEVI